jgi:hypothetical protein
MNYQAKYTQKGPEMTTEGNLGNEIARKSAEIRTWPAWAQPFTPTPTPHDSHPSSPAPVEAVDPPTVDPPLTR